MKLGVYLFPALMFAFVAYLAIRETRETARRWKLEQRIGEIGEEQTHGTVDRLVYPQFIQERNR